MDVDREFNRLLRFERDKMLRSIEDGGVEVERLKGELFLAELRVANTRALLNVYETRLADHIQYIRLPSDTPESKESGPEPEGV